jgi:hypothetical protein
MRRTTARSTSCRESRVDRFDRDWTSPLRGPIRDGNVAVGASSTTISQRTFRTPWVDLTGPEISRVDYCLLASSERAPSWWNSPGGSLVSGSAAPDIESRSVLYRILFGRFRFHSHSWAPSNAPLVLGQVFFARLRSQWCRHRNRLALPSRRYRPNLEASQRTRAG